MLSNAPLYTNITVADLEKAKRFYRDILGLKISEDNPNHGVIFFQAGGGTYLEIFESDLPKGQDTVASFKVPNLKKEMADLKAKGVKFEDYNLDYLKTVDGVATWGKDKAAWFKDPDGNILCLHGRGKE